MKQKSSAVENNLPSIDQWMNKDAFIQKCIDRFGSMVKHDYEIELFHLMLENGYENLSDFEISIRLRIPESKVKRMRYETSLIYPKFKDDSQYREELAKRIVNLEFRVQNERIQFAISDKILKLYINNLLMTNGRFLDTSFNANIISITPDDLLFILGILNEKDDDSIKKIRSSVEKGKKKLPKTVCEALTDMLKTTTKEAIKKVGATDKMIDCIGEFGKTLWNKINEQDNDAEEGKE